MTHDELLAVVNDYETGLSNGMVRKENVFAVAKAFRAVVELHKPLDSLWYKQIICESCQEGNDYPITYPCETIQAIEKELI